MHEGYVHAQSNKVSQFHQHSECLPEYKVKVEQILFGREEIYLVNKLVVLYLEKHNVGTLHSVCVCVFLLSPT